MKLVQESRGEHAGGGVMYVRGLCEGTAKLEGQASVSKAYAAFKICSPDRLPRNPPTGAKDSRPKHLDCRGKRNRQRRIIFVRAAYSVAVAGALFMALTIGRAQTVPIDGALVDLIDQTAPNFYNTGWGLSLEQFKAWLATIAWAEGGYGGYGAHSGGSLGSDYYYHVAVGAQFTFSTGLGPFQLDRGSSESWGLWPSIRKLNPHQSVESAARWHRDNFGAGATLGMFANNSVWVAVQAPADYWYAVTGTSWATLVQISIGAAL